MSSVTSYYIACNTVDATLKDWREVKSVHEIRPSFMHCIIGTIQRMLYAAYMHVKIIKSLPCTSIPWDEISLNTYEAFLRRFYAKSSFLFYISYSQTTSDQCNHPFYQLENNGQTWNSVAMSNEMQVPDKIRIVVAEHVLKSHKTAQHTCSRGDE